MHFEAFYKSKNPSAIYELNILVIYPENDICVLIERLFFIIYLVFYLKQMIL